MRSLHKKHFMKVKDWLITCYGYTLNVTDRISLSITPCPLQKKAAKHTKF